MQLEFGKYSSTKESYVIQLISRAKYLEPILTEPDMVNKLAHHFGRGIQVAVTTQGVKSLEELLLLLTKWRWEERHEHAFNATKNLYSRNIHVFHPEKEGTYFLNCDASDYAIEGVLYQRNEKGEHKVIAHNSRSLKGAERNYFTSEKEILAIVYCISKFRYYLVGQHFEILSDNQALSFMLRCKLANARISRWIMAIQEYDFTIKYCKASENKTADTLSRYPPVMEERHASDNK